MSRFIRFQGVERNARGGYSGVFGLVNRLARDGVLSPEEERFRRETNRWYDRAYPMPSHVYAAHPRAAAWFKAEARWLVAPVGGYLAVLERHGIGYVVLRSDDPGRVVYEDAYQVVVVPDVELRVATTEDSAFVFRVHREAMGDVVGRIWGWDERVQWEMHARAYTPDRCRIVRWHGRDVGMIDVRRSADAIYLGRIEILPGWQNLGIGTRLVEELIAEAGRDGKVLELDVLVGNPRAYALYRRLGFREIYRHGDGMGRRRMRWSGNGGPSAGP